MLNNIYNTNYYGLYLHKPKSVALSGLSDSVEEGFESGDLEGHVQNIPNAPKFI